MTEKSWDAAARLFGVVGAAARRATTLGRRPRRRQKSALDQTARSGAAIVVMFEATSAVLRIATRQWQTWCTLRQKSYSRHSKCRRARSFPRQDRHGVIRIDLAGRRLGRWRLRSEQITERPPRRFWSHRSSSAFLELRSRARARSTSKRSQTRALFRHAAGTIARKIRI